MKCLISKPDAFNESLQPSEDWVDMTGPNLPFIGDMLGLAGSLCLAKPWFTDFRFKKRIDNLENVRTKGGLRKRQMQVVENFRQTLDLAPASALIWMRVGILLIFASFVVGGSHNIGLL